MVPETAPPSPPGLETDSGTNREEAVETFRFEVSAGKRLSPVVESESLLTGPAQPTTVLVATKQPSQVMPQLASISRAIEVPVAKQSRKGIRSPAWLGSLMINGGILAGMAFVSITGLPQGFDFTLSLSSEPVLADEASLAEISIDPLEEFDRDESQLAGEVMQTALAISEMNDEVSLADFASSSLADAALSDSSDLFVTSGGLAEIVPSGEKLTASFFGTKVDGRRILYVLDNSGGMQDGELESLIDELLRSVEALNPKQKFYVIFYSDMVYPIFYPDPKSDFIPAHDRAKKQLKEWLASVEFCMGNVVDEAMQIADELIRPDVVYLLTDGDLDSTRDQRRLAYLLDSRRRRFPIHTFGMGTGEHSKPAQKLRQVAEANNGVFRAVKVSTEARARAEEMNRPYHEREPGRVWGLNVGRGWGR